MLKLSVISSFNGKVLPFQPSTFKKVECLALHKLERKAAIDEVMDIHHASGVTPIATPLQKMLTVGLSSAQA